VKYRQVPIQCFKRAVDGSFAIRNYIKRPTVERPISWRNRASWALAGARFLLRKNCSETGSTKLTRVQPPRHKAGPGKNEHDGVWPKVLRQS